MKIQVHQHFDSKLPADDDHPYRIGAWRPQQTEYDAWDLEVEGEVPRDLTGVYLRNTENPLLPPVKRYHPFDGDGMLHSISFEGGEAKYRNRFVRTEGFLAEREAGEPLWAGIAENAKLAKREDGWGARPGMKDASSTDIVVHNGVALSSFWLCGDLYRSDPWTLEALGREDYAGDFPPDGISAHPKIDEITGEMLFFNYGTEAPYMHFGVVDARGQLAHYIDVPLPGPRLPHDMAFTENFAIVNDCPMFWDPDAMRAGHYRDALLSLTYRPASGSFLATWRNGRTSAGSRPTRPSCSTGSTHSRTAMKLCWMGSSSRRPRRRCYPSSASTRISSATSISIRWVPARIAGASI